MTFSPQLVTTQAGLEACVAACRQADAVAVDTEFMRTDTFYPILGLIQISTGDAVWLIDPLPIDDFTVLDDLFSDPTVVKVFHSCSEDLEVLRHQLGLVPAPLFDTQIAAAFLGYGYSRGYSTLVSAVLDINLDKHETRSDWLQRPLSPAQCQYAAEDVFYLLKVYRHLQTRLAQTGRETWMAEEMAELLNEAREPLALEEYYLRVKGAWKLSLPELALLRELTLWREREARTSNRPRNRVLSDAILLDIVAGKANSAAALWRIEGFHSGLQRRYGEQVLAIVQSAVDTQGIERIPPPSDRDARQLLASCRALVEQKAGALKMAPELLARKKDMESLIRSHQNNATHLSGKLASGWRYPIIGEELYSHVANATV